MKTTPALILWAILLSLFISSCENSVEGFKEENNTSELYSKKGSFIVPFDTAKEIALYGTTDKERVRKPLDEGYRLPVFSENDINNAKVILDRENNPAMYLFNADNGGFLLMSASYLEQPILAYSNENNFELSDMPMGLANWIHLGTIKIAQLNEKGIYYSKNVLGSWSALGETNSVSDLFLEDSDGSTQTIHTTIEVLEENIRVVTQAPLITDSSGRKVAWGQGKEYNALMSGTSYCNNLALVGCIPVAMAQVMYYHKKPSNIDFNSMPYRLLDINNSNDLSQTSHGAIKLKNFLKNVSFLVIDPVISNCSVSNASGTTAINVFKNNYNYANDIMYKNYDGVDAYTEIVENKRPIIVRGARRNYEKYVIKISGPFGASIPY